MRKGILLLAILIFSVVLIAGCGSGEEKEVPKKTGAQDTEQHSKPVEMKMEGQMPDSAAMVDSAAALKDTAQAMMKGKKGGGH